MVDDVEVLDDKKIMVMVLVLMVAGDNKRRGREEMKMMNKMIRVRVCGVLVVIFEQIANRSLYC